MGKTVLKRNKTLFMRPMAVASALILCFCLAGVTGLAASGKLQGLRSKRTSGRGAKGHSPYCHRRIREQ